MFPPSLSAKIAITVTIIPNITTKIKTFQCDKSQLD